jgi:hypothetical protein
LDEDKLKNIKKKKIKAFLISIITLGSTVGLGLGVGLGIKSKQL